MNTNKNKITLIACGKNHTLFLTEGKKKKKIHKIHKKKNQKIRFWDQVKSRYLKFQLKIIYNNILLYIIK